VVYDIATVPSAIPVTIPVVPTVAIAVLLLLHEPPVVAFVKVVTNPAHTLAVPLIAEGFELTVTVAYVLQLPPSVYVILDVPAATPVTTPAEFILAFVGALLLQVPPVDADDNEVVKPTQTLSVPVIEDGTAFTLTMAEVAQPVASV
jgi:hypothetical protein